MKPTELRIGNLINRYFEGEYTSQDSCTIRDIWEVHSSNENIPYTRSTVFTFEPIPLTENWLVKFGFEEEVKNIDYSPMPRFVVWRKGIFTYNTNHGWWIDNACNKENDIDKEKPVIDLSGPDAFPQNCDTIYFGESFNFNVLFSDNVELGSFSIDIHHNFDHHSHSTEVTECQLDSKKDSVNPLVLIQDDHGWFNSL